MAEEEKKENTGKSDEIDLIEVFLKIWGRRNYIYKIMALFFVAGLIIILGSPKEYKSEVVLLVESSSSGSGMSGILQQFGGLAALGGLGASAGQEALTPKLYPDIIKSTPFLLETMAVKLSDSRYDSTLMVSEYLERHTRRSLGQFLRAYTLGLPGKLVRLIKGRNRTGQIQPSDIKARPLKLTSRQSRLAGELSKRIKAKEGDFPNTLILSAEMQDPQLAAQLVDSVVKSLTAYVIDYRTQKTRTDLQFIELNLKEAEKKYNEAQRALAAFQDRNLNLITSSGKIMEQNLQSEYTLAFNVYNTLAQQREQAKIRVQEKTPVFKVMEPAKIPLGKSKPKGNIIIILMIFLGGFVGVLIVIGKLLYNNFKRV